MDPYENKTVLITGGTGSFGKTMTTHLLSRNVSKVKIFSRDEAKQHYMRLDYNDPRLDFYVGDIRDFNSIDSAMVDVDMVFHAAALKQVPSCEFFPQQAVMTNITGSANVIKAAQAKAVSSVVFLSTDKAVQPVNTMGMTKALMEKVAQAASRQNRDSTTISTVRYGNVLYSRGSVIPLFVQQIKDGMPLTITDPTMTRFLMPLAQCVDLVENAFFNAKPGDIFVRKAPSSTMGTLAQAVCELFDVAYDVKFIGHRHGEKLYESLCSAEELRRAEETDKYFSIPMDSRDLNYADYFEKGEKDSQASEDYTSHNTELLTVDGVKELLSSVPEFMEELNSWKSK